MEKAFTSFFHFDCYLLLFRNFYFIRLSLCLHLFIFFPLFSVFFIIFIKIFFKFFLFCRPVRALDYSDLKSNGFHWRTPSPHSSNLRYLH